MTPILFYCVGTREHGMGHVIRSLVLAEHLRQRGLAVSFATPAKTPGAERIQKAGQRVTEFGGRAENFLILYAETTDTRFPTTPPCLIVDVEYGPSREFLQALRPRYNRIVILGGVGYGIHKPEQLDGLYDLQIWQSILPPPVNGDRVMAGVDNMIIRPEYAECQPDYESGHVVVSLGGSDPHGLTGIAIETLARIGRRVVVVIGPAADIPRNTVVPLTTDVVVAPELLAPFLDGAALCVAALGMTAYESLAAGVPVLLTNWTADHERTALELERRGVAWNTGTWEQFETCNLRGRVTLLLDDPCMLRRMGEKGRKLVDGQGAGRVADRIVELLQRGELS